MDELMARALAGEASELELHKLARWREASTANERAFRECEAVWVSVATGGEAPVARPPEVARVVAEAEARRRRAAGRSARRAFARSPWTGYALAAGALAALAIVVVRAGDDADPASALSTVESATGRGDVVTMALSDGSVVRTAPATRVEFPPVSGRREVVLQGRAFFAVAHGDEPFVVRTAAGEITVTGTRFEVRTEPAPARVVVVEGTVHVEGAGGASEARGGQVVFLTRGSAPRVVDRGDPWSLLQWEGGLLVFQATPLREVAAEIGRHFGRTVRVAPGLEARRVTAWFGDESLEEVVSAVCLVVAARCEVNDTTVMVGP